MRYPELHPPWFLPLICGLLFLALAQWLAIALLLRRKGVVRDLREARGLSTDVKEEIDRGKDQVPFRDDIYFMIWNLLPIALIGAYVRLWYQWEDLRRGLGRHLGPAAIADFAGGRSGWITFAVALGALAGAVACLAQFRKQTAYRERSDHPIYWWDRRISRTIFTVRLVALAPNMFAVVFLLVTFFGLAVHLMDPAALADPTINLLHADDRGGLGALDVFTFSLALPLLLCAGTGVAGLFDHWGHADGQLPTDLLLAAMIIPAVLVVTVPAVSVNGALEREHRGLSDALDHEAQGAADDLRALLALPPGPGGGRAQALRQWLADDKAELAALESTVRYRRLPLSWADVVALLLSLVLPLVPLTERLLIRFMGRAGTPLSKGPLAPRPAARPATPRRHRLGRWLREASLRQGIAGAVGLALVLEGLTLLSRFGLGLQSTRDTAFIGALTFGVRIHHGYIGAALLLVGWRLGSKPLWRSLLLIVGGGLLLSDLVHHFAVLWPITGSPQFDLTYPAPSP